MLLLGIMLELYSFETKLVSNHVVLDKRSVRWLVSGLISPADASLL